MTSTESKAFLSLSPFSLFLRAPRGTHFTLIRLPARWRTWKTRFSPSSPILGPEARQTEQSRTIDRDSLNTYLRIVPCHPVRGGGSKDSGNVCWWNVAWHGSWRRRVWRKFAKGINRRREANGVATCANEPDVLLPLTIVQYRGRHRPRNESLNRV